MSLPNNDISNSYCWRPAYKWQTKLINTFTWHLVSTTVIGNINRL